MRSTAVFQRPIVEVTQLLLRTLRKNPETRLCEEIPVPGEDAITAGIKDAMAQYTKREYAGRIAERAGNTKTYGVVRAEFHVLEDIPAAYKHGVFAHAEDVIRHGFALVVLAQHRRLTSQTAAS